MEIIKKTITYKSKSGKEIKIEHVTERESLADHNIMTDCDDIQLTVAGNLITCNCNCIIDHPTYGRVIKVAMHGPYCEIDPVQATDIEALFAGRDARWEESLRKSMEEEKKYRQTLRNVCPHCHTYCDGDCQAN